MKFVDFFSCSIMSCNKFGIGLLETWDILYFSYWSWISDWSLKNIEWAIILSSLTLWKASMVLVLWENRLWAVCDPLDGVRGGLVFGLSFEVWLEFQCETLWQTAWRRKCGAYLKDGSLSAVASKDTERKVLDKSLGRSNILNYKLEVWICFLSSRKWDWRERMS